MKNLNVLKTRGKMIGRGEVLEATPSSPKLPQATLDKHEVETSPGELNNRTEETLWTGVRYFLGMMTQKQYVKECISNEAAISRKYSVVSPFPPAPYLSLHLWVPKSFSLLDQMVTMKQCLNI